MEEGLEATIHGVKQSDAAERLTPSPALRRPPQEMVRGWGNRRREAEPSGARTPAGGAGPGPGDRRERTKMAAGPPPARPAAGGRAERRRAFPSVPRSPEARSRARQMAPPRSLGVTAPARGGGRMWAAISCFLYSFPQLWVVAARWAPAFRRRRAKAAWTATPAPAPCRPQPRAPPASPRKLAAFLRSARPPPRRGQRSGPDAGHQRCGGGRRVSARAGPGVGGRGWGQAASGRAPRIRRGPAGPPPGQGRGARGASRRPPRDPAARAWFRLALSFFGGGGGNRRSAAGESELHPPAFSRNR